MQQKNFKKLSHQDSKSVKFLIYSDKSYPKKVNNFFIMKFKKKLNIKFQIL
jgi:hypothetical protein